MNEDYNDFNLEKKEDKKRVNNSLQALKIFAIVFILLLSTAISIYLVYSYFQNNKIFNQSKDKIPQAISESEINIDEDSEAQDIIIDETSIKGYVTNDFQTASNQLDTEKNNTIIEKPLANQTKETANNSTSKIVQPKQSNKTYTVQIASFTDFDKAISLKNKLEKAGIACYIVIVEISGKYYYRVRCGKFKDKKEAIDLINKIKNIDKSLDPLLIEN